MNYTPLIRAVMGGNTKLCRHLIANGEDVNERMEFESTALHMACLIPLNTGIMELLFNNGAVLDLEDKNGMTPLQFALQFDSNERRYENATFLLQHGANIEHSDKDRNTLLFYFLYRGDRRSVEFLIRNGANVNAVNAAGQTPLLIAAEAGDIRLASLLVTNGANVNHVIDDSERNTPLLVSIVAGSEAVMSLLLRHQADIMFENRNSENAFFLACRFNRASLVRILCTEVLGLNIDMRQRATDGLTPLMVTAKYGCIDTARVLLEFGCDVWKQSANFDRPLSAYEIAKANGCIELAALIETYCEPATARL